MKKALSLLLVCAMALSMLAGCGSAPASASTPAPASGPASAPSGSEKVELTYWTTSTRLTDFELSLQEEFMKQHPNIVINNVIKEGDPGNDFYTAVAAGNAPDVVEVSFTMMDKYMGAGILEPLNTYFDAWADKNAYDQVYLDSFTHNGDLLGLVSWSTAFYLAYNKALFEKAGIDTPPATWEEALEDAKLLNDPANQVAGYSTLTAEWTEWFFQYYVWQAGGDLTRENEDGTLELTFTDPAVIEAGKYYQQLRAANVLPADLTLKFGDLQDKFAQGKIAMMPFAGDWVSIMVAKGMKVDDIGLALLPAGPSGKSVTTDIGQCMVINAKTSQEKKDAAWAYIEFMLSLDTLNKRAENMVATGGINPQIYARNDFDLAEATGMPAEWTDVVNASKGGRLEFPGKAILGSYVDRAVQNILTDPNADVEKEFAAAQESAQLEVVDDYNAEIKGAA